MPNQSYVFYGQKPIDCEPAYVEKRLEEAIEEERRKVFDSGGILHSQEQGLPIAEYKDGRRLVVTLTPDYQIQPIRAYNPE